MEEKPPQKSKPQTAKKVGLADIARRLGISKNAVSLGLRNSLSISEKTRKKIKSAAAEMGYVRNEMLSKIMSHAKSASGGFLETIALINANKSRDAFKTHPTIPEYVEGIERAAKREGFAIDKFWIYDDSLTEKSFMRILKSRGIKGGIIVGLMDDNRLPPKFKNIWNNFKFVVTGVRTYLPTFDFACADHFLIAYHATLEALKRGYKRPALVLDKKIENLIEGRFTGGFLKAQLSLKKENRIDPFFNVSDAKRDLKIFYSWFEKNKPDVLISLYNSPKAWLEKIGVFSPRDIGLISLERRKGEPEWAGMNQRNDLVGVAAVEKLSKLLMQGSGEKSAITATLISPEWVDGKTISRKKSAGL
ncbi:MAG: LacI family DNA-binding transcriptional regulator [Opitutales bacterium]|nr:LacI family DNA-binding transcriptional regulator [Opitutales bacterium]